MNFFKFIYRSLLFYWKSHLTVVIGAAISTMVITGTFIVGDSIRSSLEKTMTLRLGDAEYMFSGVDRYFRSSLATEISNDLNTEVAPILQLNGFASSQGGEFRINNVQTIGIDQTFSAIIPETYQFVIPNDNEAFISENLAHRLQLHVNDPFLLRVEKASLIPKNAPFISDEENTISLRLKVAKILIPAELGRFNLKTSQTAPYNVFVSLEFLNERMEGSGKANRLLFPETNGLTQEMIQASVQKCWTTEDMALHILPVNDSTDWDIRSDRVFMDTILINAVKKIDPQAQEILTYMVNSFKHNDKETPYSFISAGPFLSQRPSQNNEIIINSWMAEDLQASIGDSIEISYYIIGPLRKLSEESTWFIVADIVNMEGVFAEKELMPNLPGLSDAGNCRDWEAGVPVQLDKIRDKDEDYWNDYRGTPKAFITYSAGKKLWKNRFGEITTIRVSAEKLSENDIREHLTRILNPEQLGYTLRHVKTEGITAARGGVDFSQLFMGLSFFLLVAAMILLALLFNLHLEKRLSEIGTLKALGFSHSLVKRLIVAEGLFIAIPGIILGSFLAVIYNKLIFSALNTVWHAIVRTSILEEVILAKSLILGMGIAFVLIIITVWFNVNKKLRIASSELQRKLVRENRKAKWKWLKIGYWIAGLIAIGMLLYTSIYDQILNTGIFFASGALLLLSSLLFFSFLMQRGGVDATRTFSFSSLVFKNLSRNTARSFRIVILFALGTFLVISTGLNKKDLHSGSNALSSGTGGFHYYMETSVPVLKDLNDPAVRLDHGLETAWNFVQFRTIEGDDASCLNLNRVTTPRILGIPSSQLAGRFSFIKYTDDLNPEKPWESLTTELPGGVIPAVLDQTVIQWGLGKKIGDTLVYRNESGKEAKLKIIGGLANSIFQGNVLIDEQLFLKHFPSSSGSHVFLIDGMVEKPNEKREEIERAFRNEGIELTNAADRLAMFNQVENTYLSIFLLLGGLAMVLGTIGLGISLARNILDRGREIGILRAMGFRKSSVLHLISYEHMVLLLIGTLTGSITAFIATLPSILSEFVQASWQTAAVIVLLILLNGFIWIFLITRNYLKKNLLATLRVE